VQNATASITDADLKQKASKLATAGTFVWMYATLDMRENTT
jgi:hypothetical protein